MFIFLVASAGRHIDCFRRIRGDFFQGGNRGIGDLGLTRGSPCFCLGFGFFLGGRGGSEVAEFSEVEFLDWVLTQEGSSGDAPEEEGIAESAHVGDLQSMSICYSLH
jgi:hypothetical protein